MFSVITGPNGARDVDEEPLRVPVARQSRREPLSLVARRTHLTSNSESGDGGARGGFAVRFGYKGGETVCTTPNIPCVKAEGAFG